MPIWRPRMEWPQSRQNSEPYHEKWKEYQLEFITVTAANINLLAVPIIQQGRTKWLITNVLLVALD